VIDLEKAIEALWFDVEQFVYVAGGFWRSGRLFNYFHMLVLRLGNFMASIVLVTTNNLFIIMNNVMKRNYLH